MGCPRSAFISAMHITGRTQITPITAGNALVSRLNPMLRPPDNPEHNDTDL